MANIQNTRNNAIEVTYNPYKKEFSYRQWNTEREVFDELKEDNELYHYTKGSLHVKAYDIIKKINEIYNRKSRQNKLKEIEIYFSGTKEDEEYFRRVTEKYCHDVDSKLNVVRADTGFYSPNTAKEKINYIFKDAEKEIKSFIKENDQDLIKYNEIIKPTVPICVIGTYSAGKSSFINSLLGFELLPTAVKAETARIYEISINCENKVSKIRFWKNRKKEEFEFKDSEKKEAYELLQSFNSNKDKIISEKIEIELSLDSLFCDSPLDFKNHNYIIYDTPGSNSASNVEHLEILKNAMKDQTDGLLIMVATFDQIDMGDTNKLIDEAKKLAGTSMDMNNILVVLNKADGSGASDLKKTKSICQNSAIDKFNPAGYYHVSSAMGLGFKKGNSNWLDEKDTIPKVYRTNLIAFSDPACIDYTQLYKYDIMPQYEHDSYIAVAENGDEDKRVYYNSGLHCLETAIRDFADNSALLIKCENACKYLESAIEKCIDEIKEKEIEIDNKSDEIKQNLSKEYQELKNKLKEKCQKEINRYSKEFNKNVKKSRYLHNSLSILYNKDLKMRSETAICNMLNDYYQKDIKEYKNLLLKKTREFWRNAETKFKEDCIKIVKDTDNLTEKEKNSLSGYIMDIQLSSYKADELTIHAKIHKRFLFFKWINKEEIKEEYSHKFLKAINEINDDVIHSSQSNFQNMQNKIYQAVEQLASQYNPKIQNLIEEREKIEKELKDIKQSKCRMKDSSDTIKSLIEHKKWEEINNE